MIQDNFYKELLDFATKRIRFERTNIEPIDIVHDLIIEGRVNTDNYKNLIIGKIFQSKYSSDISFDKNGLPYKQFETNIDFCCGTCHQVLPQSEQVRRRTKNGLFLYTNLCWTCSANKCAIYRKNLKENNIPIFLKQKEDQKKRYEKNKGKILKRVFEYNKTYRKGDKYKKWQKEYSKRYFKEHPEKKSKSPDRTAKERIKRYWAKHKEALSDKYIIKMLCERRKHKREDCTSELINTKRQSIIKYRTLNEIKTKQKERVNKPYMFTK